MSRDCFYHDLSRVTVNHDMGMLFSCDMAHVDYAVMMGDGAVCAIDFDRALDWLDVLMMEIGECDQERYAEKVGDHGSAFFWCLRNILDALRTRMGVSLRNCNRFTASFLLRKT